MSNIFFSAASRRECDNHKNDIIVTNLSSSNSNINLSTLTRQNSSDANLTFNRDLKSTMSKIGGASALPVMLCGLLQKELLTQQDECSIFRNPYTGYVNSNHYSNIEQHRKCKIFTFYFIFYFDFFLYQIPLKSRKKRQKTSKSNFNFSRSLTEIVLFFEDFFFCKFYPPYTPTKKCFFEQLFIDKEKSFFSFLIDSTLITKIGPFLSSVQNKILFMKLKCFHRMFESSGICQ